MTAIDINTTIGQLVADRPSRSRLFESLGIDYCCGGKQPLADACQKHGLDANTVAKLLSATEQQVGRETSRDWTQAPLTELADHIEQTHHAYLRRELPRLTAMVDKVANVHGQSYGWLISLRNVFNGFVPELNAHMLKEERVLFPMIRQLEAGEADAANHCGGLSNPIRMMEHEHDQAGDALAKMRELTADFTPPEGACNTFRAMLDGLAELEHDMHLHVHKENSILFPRASELEVRQQGTAA
ncbi:iron-sulfur cluster repair di-iron protein [Phycisphaerales bacterium AB-hyl4]|uniref:Iron-sulfur cluster repair di-iron protein n=1 Tax=Natronomicrosphaera hydrolytica TaxID=3242702 RepID=A0ABV4U575_9BACT